MSPLMYNWDHLSPFIYVCARLASTIMAADGRLTFVGELHSVTILDDTFM